MNEGNDRKSSVGVIGAGIQGICISLFLIKKGFKVTLIDREEPGKESASYGNAGHYSPYASVPINRPDILTDIPSMLLNSKGPLALKWNYVPKMIPWFIKFILNTSKSKMMHTAKNMHQILDLALPAYDELFDEVNLDGLVENKGILYIWNNKDPKTYLEVEKMFSEMVGWAVDEGADILIGETFYYAEEAYTALKVMKQSGLPSVITIAPMGENIMRDGVSIVDTCKELEQQGGDVVGMTCFRGPNTMMTYIKEIRKTLKCHVAALPINFRTTQEHPTFFNLPDNNGCSCATPHETTFPTALDPNYKSLPLEHFAPMVRRIFSRKPYSN